MRLEKPATNEWWGSWRGWWLSAVVVVVVLAAGLLGDARLLLWALMAVAAMPLVLIAAIAMLIVPGLALLRLLWPDTLAPAERWPLAIGLSSALPPLLLLGAPLGLRWNFWLCWGYLAASALVLAWPRRAGDRPGRARPGLAWRPDRRHLLLLAITAAAVIVRLYVARDLPVGLWGDSYQHTIMAQLLVDHGGLFSSWEPYAALKTFTYHYGFHSNVAWLNWLSGYPVTRGLLVVGQLQSAFAAPLAYLLARRLLGGERAALWAALIAGFVSAVPAYYLNWGRYTQLAGQTVLPAVCVVWMALLDAARERPVRRGALLRLLVLSAIATAGLTLTHYRVAVFGACFVLAYAIYLLLARTRSPRDLAWLAGVGLAAGGLSALVVSPWLLRLREGALLRIGGNFLSTNIGADQVNSLPSSGEALAIFANPYLVALALLGVALLAWRRRWRGLVLVGWAALVALAANPYLIGLTGAGILTNFAVLIASYLVLAPLAGAAIATLFALAARGRVTAQLADRAQLLLGAALLLWGLSWQQQIVVPANQLFTPADAKAMEWIRRETPPDAQFFVNSFPAYGGTLYAGSDGGWWLPFMTGRHSNLPPLTYGSEAGEQPDYALTVNTTNAEVLRHPLASPEAAAALRAAGYRYLYDGPAASPPGEYIDPAALARSPLYQLVYQQDGVTIWRVR